MKVGTSALYRRPESGPVMDRWCEQKMWRELNVNTGGAELLSSATGLVLCIIPFYWEPPTYAISILALQASFVLLGIGTFIFHWIPHDDNHINAFDWYPMTFTCATLIYVYLEAIVKSKAMRFFSILALFIWAFFLIYSMNQYSYVFLNAVLLTPPLVVLACYTCFVDWEHTVMIWGYLVISVSLWLANHYGCNTITALAPLHAVYHITIAIAIWEAGCAPFVKQ